jgi:hypothetical protein
VNPIRPSALPPTPVSQPGQDSGKLAAQRAFFAAALGQAQAPAAASTPAAVSAAGPSAAPVAPAAEGAQRILRPGSLIDIRV